MSVAAEPSTAPHEPRADALSTPLPPAIPLWHVQGERLVRPHFSGRGLLNVPGSIARALAPDSPSLVGHPPLNPEVLPPRLYQGVRAVVLFVADGLGHFQLDREVQQGNAPNLARLLERARTRDPRVSYEPITSVFPTTTVAALGTLNTGALPAEHGLLGFTLYLGEFQTVGQMIRWGPFDRVGTFSHADYGQAAPEQFLWTPTFANSLLTAGVPATVAVNPSYFEGTALTSMLHQGAEFSGYVATSTIPVRVPRLLRDNPDRATYVFAYWPTVDTVAHVHGPISPEHGAEVAAFDLALGRLIGDLPADTLLLVTADHGHVQTSTARHVDLQDFPRVMRLLCHPPAGERRAVYLHARPGQEQALEEAARAELGHVAVVLSRAEAVREGLFGHQPLSARATQRIGDILLLARDDYQLVFEPPTEHVPERLRLHPSKEVRGMHGGLSPWEALVPLLALRT